MSRIARRANVNPATIYLRYPSKNALVCSCVEHYLAAVVKGYFALDERVASGDSLVENMVHLFRARNSDKWETVRRFRLESLYAAWHNVELQSVYADAYTRIAEHDVQTLSRSNNGDEVPFLNFSSFNRVVLFGHSLLFDYGLVQADDDLIASIESGVFNLLMVHSDAEDDV
jgi:AcrR family transcriptional regulator